MVERIVTVLLLFGTVFAQDWQRTIIFLSRETQPGENVFIRGGIAEHIRPNCINVAASDPCAIAIKHRIIPSDSSSAYYSWSEGDLHLDWYGSETGQGAFGAVIASGTPMIWTTSTPPGVGDPIVEADGHGYSAFNRFGDHYWMLDIDMDCSSSENGWFEFKSYVTPLPGWESNINQYSKCAGLPTIEKPYLTTNHLGRCGMMNVFYDNEDECNMFTIPINPSAPPPTGCGVRRMFEDGTTFMPYIVNGNPATVGRWPWQGVLQYGNTIGGCAGVLIDTNWALTAAHCVTGTDPAILRIRFGEQNLYIDQGNEQPIRVSNIIIHERYINPLPSDVDIDFDIALLHLMTPANINNNYIANMACLPSGYELDAFVGANCWATGFGSTQGPSESYRLNEINVPVLSHADCQESWGANRISVRQVCMGDGVKSACGGDSGGPLVCHMNGRWILVGTTSWGESSCQSAPSVYTRITEFLSWISSNTGIPTN